MSAAPPGLVTLLTDFGLADPFVGVMKGVLFGIDPKLGVIDITHGIGHGAVGEGAFWLERSFRYFPAGSVHCAVVDPGVGSARRAVVMHAERHYFVGPDNGLLAELTLRTAHHEVRVIDLSRHGLSSASHTFHGRDVFAVVAGRLAAKQLAFDDVGELAQLAEPSPVPGIVSEPDGFVGNVLMRDHFGNLITTLRASEVLPHTGAGFRLQIAGKQLRSVRTFSEAEPEELVALVGSFDTIEIAVRDGSAAAALRPVPGATVKLLPS